MLRTYMPADDSDKEMPEGVLGDIPNRDGQVPYDPAAHASLPLGALSHITRLT